MSASDWTKYAITTGLTFATICIGLIQFGSSFSLSVRTPFVQEQMKQCLAASEAAATMATTTDWPEWQKARNRFFMLFYGPLAIVEDVEGGKLLRDQGGALTRAMGNYRIRLQSAEIEGSEPHPLERIPPKAGLLLPEAREIAFRCRDLLMSTWNTSVFERIRGSVEAWLAPAPKPKP